MDIPKHSATLSSAGWNVKRQILLLVLRFDAIHGRTHYWLNGNPLGYSENLLTPVVIPA